MAKTKKLYAWNWTDTRNPREFAGYNQCWASTKAEARRKGNAMCPGTLVIKESSFRLVSDPEGYWKNLPLFD